MSIIKSKVDIFSSLENLCFCNLYGLDAGLIFFLSGDSVNGLVVLNGPHNLLALVFE